MATILSKTQLSDVYNTKPLNIVLHSSFGGRSHIKGILEIGEELIKRGHKLTYASTEDNMHFTKGYNIGNYSIANTFINHDLMQNIMSDQAIKKTYGEVVKAKMNHLGYALAKSYENTYLPLKQYLTKTNPDLLVCDFFAHACIDLAKQLSIPLITSLQTTDAFGIIPKPYITEDFNNLSITTKDINFYQRFCYQVIYPILSKFYMKNVFDFQNQIRKKYKVITSNSFIGDVNYSLFIASTFMGFEPAVPLHPNLFQLGPIVSENKDQLSTELKSFLNHNERTLYIAFGSNAILDNELASKLLKAALLAINENIIDGVVWGLGRTNQKDFPIEVNDGKGGTIKVADLINNAHSKIKLLKWAPQVSILKHNNTKLFISHGGLESSFEAIYSGTPILCLALFSDQPRNARKIEDIGVGVYVDKFEFSPQSLKEQFKLILEDKQNKFKYNLQRMKTLAYHSSKRIHFGADLFEQHAYTAKSCRKYEPYDINSNLPPCELEHLIPVSNHMSFIKSNNIDIYFVVVLLILITLVSSLILCYVIIKGGINLYNKLNIKFKLE